MHQFPRANSALGGRPSPRATSWGLRQRCSLAVLQSRSLRSPRVARQALSRPLSLAYRWSPSIPPHLPPGAEVVLTPHITSVSSLQQKQVQPQNPPSPCRRSPGPPSPRARGGALWEGGVPQRGGALQPLGPSLSCLLAPFSAPLYHLRGSNQHTASSEQIIPD